METNPKNITTAFLVIVLVAAALVVGWFWRGQANQPNETGNDRLASIGEEDARQLLDCQAERVEDRYVRCDIEIGDPQVGGQVVTATYHGFFDDSVAGGRTVATVVFRDGEWVIVEKEQTFVCQEGRGHQDYSSEPCI